MSFENYFPLWNDLNTAQKKLISDNLITQHVKKGTIIHNGNMDCTGLLLVKSGQLRTYILSNEGQEITLYRLFDMDICLLSASCIIRSIQFEVTIEAEKDTDLWIIPAEIYKGIMSQHPLPSKSSREVTKEQTANLYHRNFTSAGYSASSVEKYHYPSDCHRRNRGNLLLIPGVLAVLQCRSHGVPDKVAKIIRIKVLVNDLFSCQNTSERADLFVVRN